MPLEMQVPFRLQHPSVSPLLFVLYVLHQQSTDTRSGLLCPGLLLHCIYCMSSVAFSSNGEHWQLQCMSSAHTCSRSLHPFCPDSPQIFHKDCFTCSVCQGWLEPGEEAAIKEDGLYCRKHKDVTGGLGEAAVHAVVTPECAQVWCACVCMRVCVCVCVCVCTYCIPTLHITSHSSLQHLTMIPLSRRIPRMRTRCQEKHVWAKSRVSVLS